MVVESLDVSVEEYDVDCCDDRLKEREVMLVDCEDEDVRILSNVLVLVCNAVADALAVRHVDGEGEFVHDNNKFDVVAVEVMLRVVVTVLLVIISIVFEFDSEEEPLALPKILTVDKRVEVLDLDKVRVGDRLDDTFEGSIEGLQDLTAV
jgi:hypothetical protein